MLGNQAMIFACVSSDYAKGASHKSCLSSWKSAEADSRN